MPSRAGSSPRWCRCSRRSPRPRVSALMVRPAASFSTSRSSRVCLTSRGDALDGEVPGLLFPHRAARRPVHDLRQPPVVDDVLLERDALRAERALIDGMIGVTLDVDDGRLHVARAIAQRVDDHAAADRAVGTGRARFGGPRDLQLAHRGVGGRQVEAEDGGRDAAERRWPSETPCGSAASGLLHVRHESASDASIVKRLGAPQSGVSGFGLRASGAREAAGLGA